LTAEDAGVKRQVRRHHAAVFQRLETELLFAAAADARGATLFAAAGGEKTVQSAGRGARHCGDVLVV
jgi:hypothetical protein